MQVIDFSGRAPVHYPDGVVGAVRYIAPRRAGGSRRPKCITPDELDAHRRAGRQVGFVFEDSATNSMGGAAQGDRDGRVAVAELRALGVPAGVACYAAVDHDVDGPGLPVVAAYLDAFHRHTTAAGYRRGVYGEYSVIVTMLRDRHADLGWQTVAWSGGRRAAGPGVVLYQRAQQINLDGTPCDVNDVLAADWGQWNFAAPAPAPKPTPEVEHVNHVKVQATPDGVAVDVPGLDGQVHAVPFDYVVGLVPIQRTQAWAGPAWAGGQAIVYADPAADVVVSFT